MEKLDKIGFLAAFIGGLVGIVFGILNLVGIAFFQGFWYLGGPGLLSAFGIIGIWGPLAALIASALALLIGLKTFIDILDIDLIIWGIILIILGALALGIGGYIIIIGGILLIIARFL